MRIYGGATAHSPVTLSRDQLQALLRWMGNLPQEEGGPHKGKPWSFRAMAAASSTSSEVSSPRPHALHLLQLVRKLPVSLTAILTLGRMTREPCK